MPLCGSPCTPAYLTDLLKRWNEEVIAHDSQGVEHVQGLPGRGEGVRDLSVEGEIFVPSRPSEIEAWGSGAPFLCSCNQLPIHPHQCYHSPPDAYAPGRTPELMSRLRCR